MQKKNLLGCSAISLIVAGSLAAPAYAQLEDEVIVTATKRAETAQDVPIAVAALGESTLEELRVDVFTDYLVQLPGVTAGGAGPGNNTIYIRGLASTTPATSIAGVAGLAPNVAFYLDEQPLVQPGRNLDVYAADLERVEVLSGPQGTLFGASSQAGTVRMITNKPKIGVEEANFTVGTSFTKGGDASFKGEAVYNVPVSDNLALRAVVYGDRQGGWTDAVAGQLDVTSAARYRSADAVRDNGTLVGSRAGFDAGADTSGINAIPAIAIEEKNQNDATYFGFRTSALFQATDDWSLLVGYAHQQLQTDGIFLANPDLGSHKIQTYEQSELDDEYDNLSWTLKGRLGALEAVYTGAYTDRKAEQRIDYSEYVYVSQYLPYYICDYSTYSSAYSDAEPTGTCQAPNLYGDVESNLEVQTHELRFNTPAEKRIRATVGGFYSDTVLEELVDFNYPGNKFIFDADGDGQPDGYPLNFRFPGPGFSSDDTAFPEDTIFRNDVRRTDKQLGVFGEGSFDLTDQFSITLGARYYDNSVDLEGTANSSFCNLFSQEDRNAFGTDINDLYDGDGSYTFTRDCNPDNQITFTLADSVDDIRNALPANRQGQAQRIFNELRAPDKAEADGLIKKATLTYTPNEEMLFYGTYSEGYRPGLLNRPGGAVSGNFTVPFELETDDVTNFELGWKTRLMDNQLQFNGSAFFVDIENLQATIFDTSIVNLFFNANVGDAEIKGVEGEITYAPFSMEGLTITGAYSFLDTEITKVDIPTDDVREGDSLSFAPKYQFNVRARYEWDTASGLTAHVMPQLVHSAKSFSDIIVKNRDEIQGWTKLSVSAGLTADAWTGEIFVDNILDADIELNRQHINDVSRVSYARPLNAGARLSVKFR
ncbi:TonB-dependent receptor [Hellea balneolensis]|uniref:TonB-dependent receptor n=1 Tax=Hellea balneolensis TaxID=287478 RepID=UPI00041E2CB4|nr:TonB-dependent receptor [Hellea balneolensis]